MKYLVFDTGLFCEQANALWKKEGDVVWYYTPYINKNPHYVDFIVGKDFDHLEKVLYFEDYIEKADCIVFLDVLGNSLCNFLRKIYPNKSIWGAGLGERLENDRLLLKEWCKELELQVSPYVEIKGIKNLEEHLKKNKNKYVKINIFRGDTESFFAKDFEYVKMEINKNRVSLGPDEDTFSFTVEDEIKSDVEVGVDTFFNGTEYVGGFMGYEMHKNLYIAKPFKTIKDLPVALYETMDAFQPLFSKMNYRGALSTEEKIVDKNHNYFIDACMRLPNPLSALYPVLIKNWADVVYNVGKGNMVDIECDYKYVGAFGLSSLAAKDNYVKIEIDPKHRNDVRYQMVCGGKNGVYSCPGWEIVAILVAGGNSVDEVLNKLKENAKYVDAHFLDKDPLEGIDMIKEVIKKGENVGIKFS
jgi:hypothetical protein